MDDMSGPCRTRGENENLLQSCSRVTSLQ